MENIKQNQHYIPRFILKGFSECINPNAKKKDKKFYTYKLAKEGFISHENIEEIASEKFFYEKYDLDLNLIENIFSNLEQNHSKTLLKIIDEKKLHKSQWGNISTLFLLLSVRTKNFKIKIVEEFETIRDEYLKTVDLKSEFKRQLRESLLEEINSQSTRSLGTHELIKLRDLTNLLVNQKMPELESFVKNFDVTKQLRNGLLNAISKINQLDGMKYDNYHWEINHTDQELILGDFCTMAYCRDDNCYNLAIIPDADKVDHVLMPVTSKMVIYGYDPRVTIIPDLKSTEFTNISTARLSKRFIISRCQESFDRELVDVFRMKA